jgi:hypothetical protein
MKVEKCDLLDVYSAAPQLELGYFGRGKRRFVRLSSEDEMARDLTPTSPSGLQPGKSSTSTKIQRAGRNDTPKEETKGENRM